jgi:hypothetical protein
MSSERAQAREEMKQVTEHIAKRVDYNIKLSQEIKEEIQKQYAETARALRVRY